MTERDPAPVAGDDLALAWLARDIAREHHGGRCGYCADGGCDVLAWAIAERQRIAGAYAVPSEVADAPE